MGCGDATGSADMEQDGPWARPYRSRRAVVGVFDIWCEHARRADWAEFVPAMRDKVARFEIVDEDEWRERLNGLPGG